MVLKIPRLQKNLKVDQWRLCGSTYNNMGSLWRRVLYVIEIEHVCMHFKPNMLNGRILLAGLKHMDKNLQGTSHMLYLRQSPTIINFWQNVMTSKCWSMEQCVSRRQDALFSANQNVIISSYQRGWWKRKNMLTASENIGLAPSASLPYQERILGEVIALPCQDAITTEVNDCPRVGIKLDGINFATQME